MKAVDAAINSRQWNKAVQILSVAGDSDGAVRYYVKIAKHLASINELERAEQFFVRAGATDEAIKMYNNAGKWEEAHRVICCLGIAIVSISFTIAENCMLILFL